MMSLHRILFPATCALALTGVAGAQNAPGSSLDEAWERLQQSVYERIEPDVEVSVVGADGIAPDLAREVADLFSTDVPARWPSRAQLFVIPAAKDAPDALSSDLLMEGKQVAPGSGAFQLGGGSDFVAVLLSPGAPAAFERFSWELGSEPRQLSMRVPQPVAMGRVTVDVLRPTEGFFRYNTTLAILDRATGIPLLIQRAKPYGEGEWGEWPRAIDLPMGDYVLLAHVEPQRGWHGRVRTAPRYADARVPFTVREGSNEALVARLTEPAFLNVNVTGAVLSRDIEQLEALLARRGLTAGGSLADQAAHARLRLLRDDAYPTSVDFLRCTMAGTSAAGTHLVPWIELGAQVTSSALPAGRYTLHASLPGGRSVSREVELKSGETLDVQVDFGARD